MKKDVDPTVLAKLEVARSIISENQCGCTTPLLGLNLVSHPYSAT
jgi:hypothetical protein